MAPPRRVRGGVHDLADGGEVAALVQVHEVLHVLGAALGADFDFVDDEDFGGRQGGDERPEDGDRGAHDGYVDFEDREDVDGGCGVGDVEDGDGAAFFDAQRDDAGDGEGDGAGGWVSQRLVGGKERNLHSAHAEQSEEPDSSLAAHAQVSEERDRQAEHEHVEYHVAGCVSDEGGEEDVGVLAAPAHAFAVGLVGAPEAGDGSACEDGQEGEGDAPHGEDGEQAEDDSAGCPVLGFEEAQVLD